MDIPQIPSRAAQKRKKQVFEQITTFMQQDIRFGTAQLSDTMKLHLYHELSILLSAGLDLKKSLETIVEEQKKEKIRLVFQTITTQVIHGKPLSEAMKDQGLFSMHEYYTVQIGEETGQLSHVLHQLYVYYDKKIKQKRQVIGALSYPLIVLGVAILAVLFFMNYLIPMFIDIFSRFDAELPKLTQYIIQVSRFFRAHTLTIFVSIIGVCITAMIYRNNTHYKRFIAKLVLHIPYVNTLVKTVHISRFCQTMSLLLSSHIPLSRALDMSKHMTGFIVFQDILRHVEDDVLHGSSLFSAIQKHSFFPTRMVYILKTGEEINKLDIIFEQLHTQYTDELEHKTALMNTVLEPLLIVTVGVLVAIILIAMYLPMFTLGTSM